MTSRPPIRTAPGATSCMRSTASTSVVLPAPVRPTIASVAPAGSANDTPSSSGRPSATIDRSRTSIDGVSSPRVASRARLAARPSASAIGPRLSVVQQLAHARPGGHAALPDADDPAERERRPRQQHQVAVERDQAADAHAPGDHLAPARPQHDQRADAAQHREQRHQHAARPHQRQRPIQVLVVDGAKRPLPRLLQRVVLDHRDAGQVLLDRVDIVPSCSWMARLARWMWRLASLAAPSSSG